jgi:hypothetical protein
MGGGRSGWTRCFLELGAGLQALGIRRSRDSESWIKNGNKLALISVKNRIFQNEKFSLSAALEALKNYLGSGLYRKN